MCASLPVVGLIPAAGFARRISSQISVSKEVFPVMLADGYRKPVASFLIDSFQKAGTDKAYVILREGKWDIPETLANDKAIELPLAYIVTGSTSGVPFTLDKSYGFIKDSIVFLGFPDIIFRPVDAFQQLLQKQERTDADLVLGLFKTQKPHKADMVSLDGKNELQDIVIKPEQTSLSYTWIIALWTPAFTEFLHDFLSANVSPKGQQELHIGEVVRAAIHSKMKTSYVTFDSGSFLDIGTPEELSTIRDQSWMDVF
ncbi:nucleotidyltransferase family protein [Fodinibius sp. Rm-B-1B1-1]|uniref:nucleotidyltransferase family protein n=1 Tax=Fodinibius alkaliphilus TaxID=3140241 RepID=UPI00315A271D